MRENNARIMSGMLQRLFYDGAVKAYKTEFPNIWKLEFWISDDPDSLYNQTFTWYEYSDECEQFSEGYFVTPGEAQAALEHYCRTYL
ncbi:hypothetical protein fuchur_90 [Salmonella phage fuchur]|uniref:Uncharacterized protein n=1 Tax=Salmonella phage fuchur TaxID=2713299 RepID=A0A6G8RHL8_9CAUD|nr:hypothetical protein HWD25_gp090 [Salmonella phage fuchur]QIO00685.1 hypothetical protein fuchur_90 [Salmonella phage fuchur]